MKNIIAVFLLFTFSSFCYAYDDSSTALQAQIDTNCATQNIVNITPGKYYLYSPLIIKTNCKLIGEAADYRTVLIPVGVPAIIIDGSNVDGGWAFRNLLKDFSIDGSLSEAATLIVINKAYNTKISNMFIYKHVSPLGIHIKESNDILLNEVIMRGTQNSTQTGILIGDRASVFIRDSDIEVYSRCIKTEGDSVTDLSSTYMERCIVNIEHNVTSGGSLSVFGGKLRSINGYNIQLKSGNFSLYGTKLESWNASVLDGRVIHCWISSYTNVQLNGVSPYPGYLDNTNCEGKGVID